MNLFFHSVALADKIINNFYNVVQVCRWFVHSVNQHILKKEMKMKDDNCIFCKLANGEIPTATLYEDEDFRVILDASPASKGHALIIPKEHYANLYELENDYKAYRHLTL